MKVITRTRRWQPVFRAAHHGRVFFYSGAARAGSVAFFHHHHGDHRPHLHLVEDSPHEHRAGHHDHLEHDHLEHDHRASRLPGHWHFAYPGSAARRPHLFQYIALEWVDFSRAPEEQEVCPRLAADHWARPPPL
jgi:hypothetical protein